MSGEFAEGVRHYIKEGPRAGGDSLPRTILGFYLWWRVWAMMAIVTAAFLVVGYITDGAVEGLYAFGIGIVTAWAVEAVSDDDFGVFN